MSVISRMVSFGKDTRLSLNEIEKLERALGRNREVAEAMGMVERLRFLKKAHADLRAVTTWDILNDYDG